MDAFIICTKEELNRNFKEKYEYTVEFTQTVKVMAEDAVDAVEQAKREIDPEKMTIYVGGDLYR